MAGPPLPDYACQGTGDTRRPAGDCGGQAMTTVRQLINRKGDALWRIAPGASVYEAIEMMADLGIGALPVMEGAQLVGIVSERDYARKVILQGRSSRDTPVRDIMTTGVITATPSQTVDDCMGMMTDERIRHLPIMDGDRVIGMISIGDVVKAIIAEKQTHIEQLELYIASG